MVSNIKPVLLVLLSAFVCATHSVTYDELVDMGVTCPERDSCEGYRNNLDYTDRSCECDPACSTYKDCCADAVRRRKRRRSNWTCLHYGTNRHTGVYAIASCSRNWNGPEEVREKCVGPNDLRDPLSASPVTDTSVGRAVTYRNIFCAECHYANMSSLTFFLMGLSCEGLNNLTEEQIFADMRYNEELNSWGVYRLNSFGNATNFYGCDITYDVPGYLNNSVRFCRANVISTCPPGWDREEIRKSCEEYMTVVFDVNDAYRNPHCAICNHKSVDEIACRVELYSRKIPLFQPILLDVNQSDGIYVGQTYVTTPQCPNNYIYDPYVKICRQLVCAFPGQVLVEGRCVRG